MIDLELLAKDVVLTDNKDFRKKIPSIDAHFNASFQELENLPKIDGIVKDKNIIDIIDCPICSHTAYKQLLVKWGFMYSECINCNHIYVKNRIKRKILEEKYKYSLADKLDRETNLSEPYSKYWNLVYEKYIKYLQYLKIDNKNLIDIGCGAGSFLKVCKNNTDFNLYANDIYDNMEKYITPITPNFYKDKFEKIDFKDTKFGIITLWGVLEHISNPITLLTSAANALTKNGKILILIPNFHSHAMKILGVSTPTLNPREHINFYTENSIRQLCNTTNLKVQALFQELPIIDLMYPYIEFTENLIQQIIKNKEAYYYIYILEKN